MPPTYSAKIGRIEVEQRLVSSSPMATMPPAVISSGPRSAERLAVPLARASPQTSLAFSGWNRIGSQPSAISAVIATFLSPSAAT